MIVVYMIFVLVVIAMGLGALELVLKHKREVAALNGTASDERIAALERKIDDLTQIVYQQTIALDGRPSSSSRLEERIGV